MPTPRGLLGVRGNVLQAPGATPCSIREPGGGNGGGEPGMGVGTRAWGQGRGEGKVKAAPGTMQDTVAPQVKGATLWSDSQQTLNFNFSKIKNPLC